MQVAAHEAKLGHGKLAEELRAMIDTAKVRVSQDVSGKLVAISSAAKPRGELANLLTVSHPANRLGDMVLDEVASNQLQRVLKEQRQLARIKAHGLTPRARIVSTALSGADPTIMLTGPMPAARKALAKAGLSINDIDLFEVNEAFAAVVMRFMKEMKVPHDKVNVNGGAIAMGHPLGATGAMILGVLIDELHRRKLRYGMATLCVGGGMGIATIVERL